MLSPLFTESDPELLVQNITAMTMQGPMSYPLPLLDDFQFKRMLITALFAVRSSCTVLISLVLFLFSQRRKTPVFIFNQLSLWLMFIQSTIYLVSSFQPFLKLSTYLTLSFAAVTQNAVNVSMACSVFQLLFVITLECSLIFQVRAVFPERTPVQLVATVFLGAVALANVVLYALYVVVACYNAADPTNENPAGLSAAFLFRLPTVSQVMFATFVSACTCVFIGKLFFAIMARRVLGLRQFGPLQIVFVMGAQSMIIPAVLTFLCFFTPNAPGISSLAPFTVVISLPLSALWAATANTPTINSKPATSRPRRGYGSGSTSGNGGSRNGGSGRRGKTNFKIRTWSLASDANSGKDFEMTDVSQRKTPFGWFKRNGQDDDDLPSPNGTNPIAKPSAFSLASFVLSQRQKDELAPQQQAQYSRNPTTDRFQPRKAPPSPMDFDEEAGLAMDLDMMTDTDLDKTPMTAREYMTRNSLDECINYKNRYEVSTRVSISNLTPSTVVSAGAELAQQQQQQMGVGVVQGEEAPKRPVSTPAGVGAASGWDADGEDVDLAGSRGIWH